MTIDKYFEELNACLKRLPAEEREDAVNFYMEYAHEGGLTEYRQMEEHFGTPQNLAAQIYAESATKQVNQEQSQKSQVMKGLTLAVAGICALPFSFPILVVVLSVGFAFLVSSLAIIFSIGVTLIALGGTAIALFIKSFSFLVPFAPILWLKTFGGSLALIAITCLITILLLVGVKYIIKLVTIALTKVIKRRKK